MGAFLGKTKWTIGKKLWMLNGFLLASFVALGLVSLRSTKLLSHDISLLGEVDLPAVRNMTLTDMMHDGIRAVVFRALIVAESDDAKLKKEVEEEYSEMSENISKYLTILSELKLSESLKAKINSADTDVKSYVEAGKTVLAKALSGERKQATELMPAFEEAFSKLEESLGKIGDEIEAFSQEEVKKAGVDAETSVRVMLLTVFCGLLFGLIFSFIISRDLIKSLSHTIEKLAEQSDQVGSSAGIVKETSRNLSDTAVEQSSAVQETAASVEEINSMVAKTSENSTKLSATVEQSSVSVQQGQTAVTQMLESISVISESSTQVMSQVEENNQKIMEIVKVINEIAEKTKVINDIVFQTKLLSFNASVEAARAGEHGKGFAVVAQEVGNLAQMSGNAAKEISVM